jgi:hypothetical protein
MQWDTLYFLSVKMEAASFSKAANVYNISENWSVHIHLHREHQVMDDSL